MPQILVLEWLESEAGWGQRPDGCTIHLSEEDMKKFVKEYWAKMPDRSQGVPECYSRPCDDKGEWCECDDVIYRTLQLQKKTKPANSMQSKHGIWVMERSYKIVKAKTGGRTFVDLDAEKRKEALDQEDLKESIPSPS